jgi:hypothetical protein
MTRQEDWDAERQALAAGATRAYERVRPLLDATATAQYGHINGDGMFYAGEPVLRMATPLTLEWTIDDQRAFLTTAWAALSYTQERRAEHAQIAYVARLEGHYREQEYAFNAEVDDVIMQMADRETAALLTLLGATCRLARLYKGGTVTLTPAGWTVDEWTDPRSDTDLRAEQSRVRHEERKLREEEQAKDERDAWKQFQQEKSRELAAARRAEIEAQRIRREASWREQDEARATGLTD